MDAQEEEAINEGSTSKLADYFLSSYYFTLLFFLFRLFFLYQRGGLCDEIARNLYGDYVVPDPAVSARVLFVCLLEPLLFCFINRRGHHRDWFMRALLDAGFFVCSLDRQNV